MPLRPASSSSSASAATAAPPATGTPAGATTGRIPGVQPLPEAPPAPDAFLENLLAPHTMSEEDLEAEIRRAVAAGDEARAFRLVGGYLVAVVGQAWMLLP